MAKQAKAKKKSKESSGGGGAQQFLIWHGEKIVVALVAVVALWFATQGLGYQTLKWQPEELEKASGEAKTAIEASTWSAEQEFKGEIKITNFEEFAQQIKQPIPASPYSTKNWIPIPGLMSSSSSSSSTTTTTSAMESMP